MVPSRSAETLTTLQATIPPIGQPFGIVTPPSLSPSSLPEPKRGSFWKLTVRGVCPAGPPNYQVPSGLFL